MGTEAVKWPGSEDGNSTATSVKVKNKWSCTAASDTCLQDMVKGNVFSSIYLVQFGLITLHY
jgi:hypothetical protein